MTRVAEYGGLQSTDEGGVKYLLADWQGSTRAIASNTGFVQTRLDYSAYGEEIASGIGQRTAAQGFGSVNSLRQKYGLTERDEATGLDHTWFRKNENRAGRWTSPDPYNGSMSTGNPQSFNRFSYVGNEPANFIDPSGLNASSAGFSWSCWVTWRSDGDHSHFQITSVSCQTTSNGGGGGGGGGATVGAAVSEARGLLKYGPCAKLYGGKNAVKNLDAMAKNIHVSTSYPNVRGTSPSTYEVTGNSNFGSHVAWTAAFGWRVNKNSPYKYTSVGVYIDQNGQFFTGGGDRGIYANSGTLESAETNNAITILHELLHWNGNRRGDAGHDADFNQKIYDNCIKNNPYYSTDPPQGPADTSG